MGADLIIKFLLLGVIHLLFVRGNKGCFEEEKKGLLEFKAFVKSDGDDAGHLLSSWVNDPEDDCCKWERVGCDSTTGHVIKLSLSNTRQFDSFFDSKYNWYLNISLFEPFKELRSLNLSLNVIAGWKQNKELSVLENIEELDLGSNILGGSSAAQGTGINSTSSFTQPGFLRAHPGAGFLVNPAPGFARNSSMLGSPGFAPNPARLCSVPCEPSMPGFGANPACLGLVRTQHAWVRFLVNPVPGFARNPSVLGLRLGSYKPSTLGTQMKKARQGSCWVIVGVGFDFSISNARFLQVLCSFADIVAILGTLPSLKLLDLSSNSLGGPLYNKDLGYLSNLEVLNLSHNSLSGNLPIQGFTRLEILDLSWNQFSGGIPPSIGALHSLKALSLSNNQLNGSLPIHGMCGLKRLQELDLSRNNFEGTLPPWLNNLTSLKLLDLSYNLFTGNLSSNLIRNLPLSLEFIDLRHNFFEGLFSFNDIGNHSKLKVCMLTGYKDRLNIDTQNPGWINLSFQLKALVLSDLNLNSVPKFLFYQQRLRVIDLSHNKLKGEFPVWLLQNNLDLKFMNLRNNSFAGQFYLPYRLGNMVWLDLSENQFTGKLPKDVGDKLPSLQYLNLSLNHFEGALPSSLGNMHDLLGLDLAFNNFSGEIPKELVARCSNLEHLIVSHNRLGGKIFSSEFNLSNLFQLELNNNEFTGSLLNVTLEMLGILDVSNNNMTGQIPTWINKGLIPKTICFLKEISIMDLSSNSFSGTIPSCLQNLTFGGMENYGKTLAQDQLQISNTFTDENHIYGDLLRKNLNLLIDIEAAGLNEIYLVDKNRGSSYKGSILNFMSALDMSCNDLTGEIPQEIGKFTQIHALNFSHNRLMGLIPVTLSKLSQIESLDLCCNNLSGNIPPELTNLNFLEVFNVSHNNLSGQIPMMKAQFSTFEKSSYEGNQFLCGPPLEKCCLINIETPYLESSPLGATKGNWPRWVRFLDLVFFEFSSC
ncbi:hypothetical protein SLEP1_g49773 [Rubroshorea leprosula]|uniref:Leucine-rich repeat-containing N-terminal plant-type domain-containing protein n=1 Tax=Rubroshorea leprosula TaxID=152421 RepID=A0AAV5LYU2_9ROSI|nr:hypothetical protein SLEP1_g49773 [Rubroshorea leprosula]